MSCSRSRRCGCDALMERIWYIFKIPIDTEGSTSRIRQTGNYRSRHAVAKDE